MSQKDGNIGAQVMVRHMQEIIDAERQCEDRVAFWCGLLSDISGMMIAAIGPDDAKKVFYIVTQAGEQVEPLLRGIPGPSQH